MEVLRFGLGIRFALPDPADEEASARQVWERICAVLAAEDAEGLQVFGGVQRTGPGGAPEDYYLALFMDGGLKQMRRVHRRLDEEVKSMLCPFRPYLENNALLRVEGLIYLGRAQRDGALEGGDAALPGMRFSGEPAQKRGRK